MKWLVRLGLAVLVLVLGVVALALVKGAQQASALAAETRPGLLVGEPGRRVHLIDSPGPGPAVVFIHGNPGTALDFSDVQRALQGQASTIAVDRPGYGWSERPALEWGPKAQAEQLHAAVKAHGVNEVVLAGFSYGGPVALAWAEAWPDEVKALVLLAPVADAVTGHPVHGVQAQLAGPFGGAIAHVLGPLMAPGAVASGYADAFFPRPADPEVVRRAKLHVARPATLRASAFDWRALEGELAHLDDAAAAIFVPVEALFANQDRVVGPEHAAFVETHLPSAHVVRLDDAGHQLMSTHTAEVVAAVQRALARVERKAP